MQAGASYHAQHAWQGEDWDSFPDGENSEFFEAEVNADLLSRGG
jgi:hypothetical protein